MNIPYQFDFNGNSRQRTILNELPAWCKYTLKAVQAPHQFTWEEAEIVSQPIHYSTFFVDLVHLKLEKDFIVPFRITEKNLSLLFLLEGEATFCTDEDQQINSIGSKSFLISIFNPGKFRLKAKAGSHTVLLITMDPVWIEKKLKKLNHIQRIVKLFYSGDNLYETMVQRKINRQVNSWLKKITNNSRNNTDAIDGTLKTHVSLILKYYNDKIKSGNHELAEQTKAYIENNFTDPALSVQLLADQFCVTRFTLLNHFKRKYNSSIQEFMICYRMEKAAQIMQSTGAGASEVYDQVGYTDVRAFHATHTDYLKRKEERRQK